MFPFWLEVSSGSIETLAVVGIAVFTWLMQFLSPRGCG